MIFIRSSYSQIQYINSLDTLILENLAPDVNFYENGIYVATNGNDQSGTGSINQPFRTINRALQVANPGDKIILRGGIYNERIRIQEPNIIIASKSGERAVISSPINDENIGECIRFDPEASGCKLVRLEIRGGYYYAIKLETKWDWGGSDRSGVTNIVIDSCIIHDSGRDCIKITPNCDSVIIRRCEIYNSGMRDNSNAEGIDNVNGDFMLVQDCYIHNIATNGVYFKGGATLCVVERTKIDNCGGGGIMVGFDTSPEFFDTVANPSYYESIYGIVRNCVIMNTNYAGIGLYAAKNAKIYNNTIIYTAKSDHSPIYFGLTFQDWDPIAKRPASINPIIKNNLVIQDVNTPSTFVYIRYAYVDQLGGHLYSLTGMPIMNNNCYYKISGSANFQDRRPNSLFDRNFSGWRNHIVNENNSMETNPLILNYFYLTSTSPCIDKAENTIYVSYDFNRHLRQGFYDIGANEYIQATNVYDNQKKLRYELYNNYPNPFNPTTTISYTIPTSGNLSVKVYNSLGQEVTTLFEGYQEAGMKQLTFNANNLNSGVYYCIVNFGNTTKATKMLLMK